MCSRRKQACAPVCIFGFLVSIWLNVLVQSKASVLHLDYRIFQVTDEFVLISNIALWQVLSNLVFCLAEQMA